MLNSKVPEGPLKDKWTGHKMRSKLINPANKRKYSVIVVGSGLAGGAAAATLSELGYKVKCFCYQDSARRAHSIAAQGGINAAKNYQNDGDSVFRLFYDTVKGGDFRSREANVYRLAEVSNNIIDQCAAQGVPFAREYGGLLANRSFGGAQVKPHLLRPRPDRPAAPPRRYQALSKEVAKGKRRRCSPAPRCSTSSSWTATPRASSPATWSPGEIESHAADTVVLATGGYGNVFFLSTNAMGCNVMAAYRAHKRGAYFANPCFTQIHPTCIPVSGDYQSKLTLMSESLRNDGRIWVPKNRELADSAKAKPARRHRRRRPRLLPRAQIPLLRQPLPRDIASRAAKEACDEGRGVAPTGLGVYLDFRRRHPARRQGRHPARYGNLFEMYQKITGDNPYQVPMRIYPAVHYTMGGLWVDYNLMSNLPGLHVIGEANFSDHGANRLGASALMQGLADGYFVIPATIAVYLAGQPPGTVTTGHPAFKEAEKGVRDRIDALMNVQGEQTVDHYHRKLGLLMWENCGMARNREGLLKALEEIPGIREDFWKNVRVPGQADGLNMELEKAGRLADFLEFAEIMCHDALNREESCGGHFREEHQFTESDPEVQDGTTQPGEAKRHDDQFCYVAAWEFTGVGQQPNLHKEPLEFENVELSIRSYK